MKARSKLRDGSDEARDARTDPGLYLQAGAIARREARQRQRMLAEDNDA